MKRQIILLCCLVLLPAQGFGRAFKTGNILLEECEEFLNEHGHVAKGLLCSSYIAGISDFHNLNTIAGLPNAYQWCLPDVNKGQLVRVVTKWLLENPDKLHFGAAGLVGSALEEAFPCE
jgi:hypothetical protein